MTIAVPWVRNDGTYAAAAVDATPYPKQFPNLALWLDAGQGVTTDTGGVSTWADQSGLGNDAIQTTDSARPDLNATDSNLNDQPSITFGAGSGQFLAHAMSASSTDWTWFAVVYAGSTSPLAALYDAGGGANFRWRATGGAMYSAVAGASLNASLGTSAGHVICARHGSGVGLMRVDATESTGTLAAFSLPGGGCIGGRYTDSGDEPWVDEIAEIIAYKVALSDTHVDAICDYLGSKYSITVV